MTSTALTHYAAQARIAELEGALIVARARIVADRASLFECHKNPRSGRVDDELGRAGLREYDEAIAHIDAALAASKGA